MPYDHDASHELLNGNCIDTDLIAKAVKSYRSRFERWDDRATVRTSPMRIIDSQEDHSIFFPPQLVPVTGHPLVQQQGSSRVRALLIHCLYEYLHFTVELENLAVIPIASKISRGRLGVDLSRLHRADAFKIVTDEAWHAQFSYDLISQVEIATGVKCKSYALPHFIEKLDLVRETLPQRVRGVEGLIFAIVSETLISRLLADLPKDQRLPTIVRDQVADHALDEGRHHAYFRDLLFTVWPALDAADKVAIGPWIPVMIRSFLEPDVPALARSLRSIGLSLDEIQAVLAESLILTTIDSEIAQAAQLTTQYFRDVGALEDPATRTAFEVARMA